MAPFHKSVDFLLGGVTPLRTSGFLQLLDIRVHLWLNCVFQLENNLFLFPSGGHYWVNVRSGRIQLLREFAEHQSDAAFAALVTRYVNLVYSVALRQTGNPHAAEEITQAVFIILARKAGSLGAKTILSGWLYQTARLTAANYRRTESRRARREKEAHMQSILNQPEPDAWPQIAPLLDDALGKLGERDRHAIVLRYFENKTLVEVGAALGTSENAAEMRVNRALEKLRTFFTKRGVMLTATVIAGAVSANSVQAAPVGLAVMVAATAAKGAVVGGSVLALVKGALKLIAWTKAKTIIVVGAVIVVSTTVTTTVLVKEFNRFLWFPIDREPAKPLMPGWASQEFVPISTDVQFRSQVYALPLNPKSDLTRKQEFALHQAIYNLLSENAVNGLVAVAKRR